MDLNDPESIGGAPCGGRVRAGRVSDPGGGPPGARPGGLIDCPWGYQRPYNEWIYMVLNDS